jgi:hypothetical protein
VKQIFLVLWLVLILGGGGGGTISKTKLWIPYISIEMPMETKFLFLYIENSNVVVENAWIIKIARNINSL